jgi:hypothetical protein
VPQHMKKWGRRRRWRVKTRREATRRPANDKSAVYERRESLLSRGEMAFYRVLRQATRGEWGISIKTRLADVIKCPDDLWQTGHGRRIAQKHVDFVLYDQVTTAIVAVIELDDRTHREPGRHARDHSVNSALHKADIPLLRVVAASRYEVADIRQGIAAAPFLKDRDSQSSPNPPQSWKKITRNSIMDR